MPLAATAALLILALAMIVVVVAGPGLINQLRESSILRRRLRLTDLAAQSPHGFEGFVERVFIQHGYKTAERRAAPGRTDGGVDLKLRAPNGQIALIQCRNWLTWRVGVEPVRALYGVVAKTGAGEGFVVTSGQFTRSARLWAKTIRPGKPPLTLLDGRDLLRLATGARASTSTSRSQVYVSLDRLERFLPFGGLVDWIDAEFQNRPIWVPLALASVVGVFFALLHQFILAVAYAALILAAGATARAWRWYQGRLLGRVTSVRDLRDRHTTRGRLQYIVAEACHRQGYHVSEFKPNRADLYCLEARMGRDRTLIQVLPRDSSRVAIEEVQALEGLRVKHRFQDAVLVSAGVFSRDTLRYAASTGVQTLSGQELVEFLSGLQPKAYAQKKTELPPFAAGERSREFSRPPRN